MKQQETLTTSAQLLAAYLLAKGLKMERLEIVPGKYFTDCCFHFPKEEAEKILRGDDTVHFMDLKFQHDCLYLEASKAKRNFREKGGRS
jgi:hypothetical protein